MTRATVRALVLSVLIGAGVAMLAGVVIALIGYGVRLDVCALAGLVVGVVVWFFQQVYPGPEDHLEREPMLPARPLSVNVDRRTRTLEAQVRGSRARTAVTVTSLHASISALAAEAAGPLPPHLRAYVRSAPRPLSRAQLRTILQELSTL